MSSILSQIQQFLNKRKKIDYIIFLLLGLLLLVIVFPSGKENTKSYETNSFSQSDTTELEKRLSQTLEKMEGVGKVQVMITIKENSKEVEGVLVVAQGAGQPTVCQKISDSVMALFDIEAHKIRIAKMVSED